MNYAAWIKEWLESNRAYGNCKRACVEMIEAFPELVQVRGHVYCDWGKRSHWWLTSPDGAIQDPTASQYTALFSYEVWTPDMEVRVGKCMDCGSELWGLVPDLDTEVRKSFCDQDCEDSFRLETGF